jgi:hypothetical protein
MLDAGHGPDLLGADHLVLVQEEHGNPGCPDQFIRLWGAKAFGCPGKSVGGGLAYPVGLVDDEHIEGVSLGLHKVVGVAEELPHSPDSPSYNLPQGDGEGPAARGMRDVVPPLGQLT